MTTKTRGNVSKLWSLIGLMVLLGLVARPAGAEPSASALASARALKVEAFEALKKGEFDRTDECLSKAADLTGDPDVQRMAAWTRQFTQQRQQFAAQRRTEYDKAVGDVKKLLDAGKDSYALAASARAYLLAEDKQTFHNEPWAKSLLAWATEQVRKFDESEDWVKALRLYSSLTTIEPTNPVWKDRLKLVTRRIRLLALYAPDQIKLLREAESREGEEVDRLLKGPTTRPATRSTDEDEAAEAANRVDWRENLRGVNMDMLWDALVDARTNYYRETSFKQLCQGGLSGVRAVVTTRGLDKSFAKLGDDELRAKFLKIIDQSAARLVDVQPQDEQTLVRGILATLRSANRQTVQLPDEVLVSEFADGAFAELDPFTSVIWPYDLEEFQKTTQGEFSGVGIQIQSDEDGSLKVVSPLEDSPAYRAGVQAGDVITHINGNSAKGITLNQAVKKITGPRGTPVELTIRRPDLTSRTITLKRDTIKVASVKGWIHRPGGGWDYLIDPQQKIGYLRVTNFTKTTAADLRKAVEEMKRGGAQGLILDLRYNPGGLLNAATEVVDSFLTEGTIVSTRADRRTPNQATVARAEKDDDEIELPVVILINQYSASASEIVSGALKDHKRAIVVGDRTFGKGSVQMLFRLDDGKAYLKLTTSHYYLPNGKCIHREENSQEWGVDPDVKVEMTPEQMRAAIDARQEFDVLRYDGETAVDATTRPADPATQAAKKDPLSSDAQLSAALLIMRLTLAGAEL